MLGLFYDSLYNLLVIKLIPLFVNTSQLNERKT
jgi:hypothetical protein